MPLALKSRILSRSGLHAALLGLVLVVSLVARLRDIHASLPYCRHTDEATWAGISMRMLRTGSLDPHRFRKPSLPVYLMSAGTAVGLAFAGVDAEATGKGNEETVHTYYLVPGALEVPKILFTLFSIASLALLGLLARSCLGDPRLLWLAPALAALSPSFYQHSWTYMNVDTIGTAFVLGTVAFLIGSERRAREKGSNPGGYRRAALAGVLVGLALGSKYNLFPVALPVVLWFVLYEPKVWFRRAAVAGSVAFVTFLVTTPYALITPRLFFDHVLLEIRHYSTGHGGGAVRPTTNAAAGWPMLKTYLSHFVESFGWPSFLLAFAGAALLARRNWKVAVVAFSYPATFIAYMAMQRVFFERNALSVELFVALGLAIALVELPGYAAEVLARFPVVAARKTVARRAAAVLTCAVVVLGTPWKAVAAAYTGEVDPRHAATRWLKKRSDAKTVVVVDRRLGIDTRLLKRIPRVIERHIGEQPEAVREIAAKEGRFFAVVAKKDSEATVAAVSGARVVATFSVSQDRTPSRPGVREIAVVSVP